MIAEVSKIQAVVFDLYNTLCANTRESWVETFKEICEIEKLTLDPADFYNYWKDLELSTRGDRGYFSHTGIYSLPRCLGKVLSASV